VKNDATTQTVADRPAAKQVAATAAARRVIAQRFELIRTLGEGGMGLVHEAHDLELDERVALKVLSIDAHLGADGIRRMRDEVRLARRITHPNVVRIFDIGEDAGTHYFTMELVAGDNLRDRIAGRPLPRRRALAWAAQIAQALKAAHAAGVIHRDLKPSNVLVAAERAVVTDFGIARPVLEAVHGEASGTPQYMAPEQREGGREEPRTDLWAFGIMLFEMLHGQRPASVADIEGDDDAARLIRRCLAARAGDRPSAAEAAELLGGSVEVRAEPAPPPVSDVSIALLPPRVLGGGLDETVQQALGYEMVDALARTRNLKVASLAATAAFAADRDPLKVGAALKVKAVVDITLRRTGPRLRADVRLIDARTGYQLWSERMEDDFDGTLALQESLAARIGEQLRVSVDAMAHRGTAPAALIEQYLRARVNLHRFILQGSDGAIAQLEQIVAEAPSFRAAAAALATARVRQWFQFGVADPSLEARAADAVAKSLESAPDLPETQVAAAALANHGGDYVSALRAVYRALALAPSCAPAHELLCVLEAETGRTEVALRRARHAIELDPTLISAHITLVLRLAWQGKLAEAEAALARAAREELGPVFLTPHTLRLAMCRGDRTAMHEIAEATEHSTHPAREYFAAIAYTAAGDWAPERGAAAFRKLFAVPHQSVRRVSYGCQMYVDALGCRGASELMLELLELGRQSLIDVAWLEQSPTLACVRGMPRFEAVVREVSARAQRIWAEIGDDPAGHL